ncbi:MAG: hypothetical protein ACM3PY_06760 [Omnitrophica WOR_2 bacterium]
MAALGHLGVSLAAKRFIPRVPLWVVLVAGFVIDLLWVAFTLAGLEAIGNVPWSHSLFMSAVWSLTAGLLAWRIFRSHRIGAAIGLVVFSHWLLDLISHPMGIGNTVRDIPLFFAGSPLVGLGLYSSIPGILAGELGLPLVGLAVYIGWLRGQKAG